MPPWRSDIRVLSRVEAQSRGEGGRMSAPAIEVPFEVPEGWTWVRLGDVGKWGAGATPFLEAALNCPPSSHGFAPAGDVLLGHALLVDV